MARERKKTYRDFLLQFGREEFHRRFSYTGEELEERLLFFYMYLFFGTRIFTPEEMLEETGIRLELSKFGERFVVNGQSPRYGLFVSNDLDRLQFDEDEMSQNVRRLRPVVIRRVRLLTNFTLDGLPARKRRKKQGAKRAST